MRTCKCQHCGGEIEFDDSQYGQIAQCPHCENEIELIVAALMRPKRKTPVAAIVVGLAVIAAIPLVWILFKSGNQIAALSVAKWSQSMTVTNDSVEVSIVKSVNFKGRVFQDYAGTVFPAKFSVTVRIKNLSDTQKIDFSSWHGNSSSVARDYATLSDNFGNQYKRWAAQDSNPQSIYPSQTSGEEIDFEPPVTNFQWLHLELPAGNFGGTGSIRFEISPGQIISQ